MAVSSPWTFDTLNNWYTQSGRSFNVKIGSGLAIDLAGVSNTISHKTCLMAVFLSMTSKILAWPKQLLEWAAV
jgi:hypothetical protein